MMKQQKLQQLQRHQFNDRLTFLSPQCSERTTEINSSKLFSPLPVLYVVSWVNDYPCTTGFSVWMNGAPEVETEAGEVGEVTRVSLRPAPSCGEASVSVAARLDELTGVPTAVAVKTPPATVEVEVGTEGEGEEASLVWDLSSLAACPLANKARASVYVSWLSEDGVSKT